MSLSILSNSPSLVAQNQLAATNSKLQNSLFQLSSGSKINSGADDPAGLAIANGLQANISALAQSTQNATNGVGMLQTADGALSQVTSLLNRAVALATEAGNSGLTSNQQTALQNEFTSITNEINQIGQNTTFNNTAVFSGSNLSVFLSDGSSIDNTSSSGPTISVALPNLSASALGLGTYATGTLDLTSQPAGLNASGTLTLTGLPSAGDSVTVNGDIYKFVGGHNIPNPAVSAGDVAIDENGNITNTLNNLAAAITGTGLPQSTAIYGPGTSHVAGVTAAVNGHALTLTSTTAGVGGNNAIGFSASISGGNGSVVNAGGGADLGGGGATNSVTIGTQTYNFVAAGAAMAANEVAVGATVLSTLQNLEAAVNGGPGAGTTYGSGTTVNTSASITSVNGGSATVQAIAAGLVGNGVSLSVNLSGGSAGGVVGGNGTLTGGTAAADLSTSADAQAALVTIGNAISNVAADRGALGAGINQMNAAVQVMNSTSQNLSSSLSGIRDANMGQVVADMSQFQVLEQTGISALAQSNQNEQVVLKLLQ